MLLSRGGFVTCFSSHHAPHAVWHVNQAYATQGFHGGFDLLCHTTKSSTMFGIACLVLAFLQALVGNICLFEQPAGGYMKWFPSWVMLLAMGCYEEISPQCRWQTTYPKYKKDIRRRRYFYIMIRAFIFSLGFAAVDEAIFCYRDL